MWQKSDCVTEIFRCHPHLGLENNKQNFIFNASRDWKPMEMFLDVVGDMGVTGSTWQECHALFQLLFQLSKHHFHQCKLYLERSFCTNPTYFMRNSLHSSNQHFREH